MARILIVSGGGKSSASDILDDARELGVEHTLAKPFGFDEVTAIVEKALSQG